MKVNFVLNSENGAIVAISDALQKPLGLVLIGKITNGNISEGEEAEIKMTNKQPLKDKIKMMELHGDKIAIGYEGQKIGICLTITNKQGLLNHMNK